MLPCALQPRREIHQQPLQELAASIKANGAIQPIVVRPLPAGTWGAARYEIVAGERRWQAAKLAGLTDIPVIVRELSDKQCVALALIENIQREELTAAEEARARRRLVGDSLLTLKCKATPTMALIASELSQSAGEGSKCAITVTTYQIR
jgi:ParB family chromosome partitioning protein